VRIGIVNDLMTAVKSLRHVLAKYPEHSVVWEAYDGAEAVKLCAQETPDLILMDLMMPVMDGVEATRQIMKSTPCAILIVTATVTGHSSKVFEAMGAGALDVVATPIVSKEGESKGGDVLLQKITRIGRILGINDDKKAALSKPGTAFKNNTLLAIGCSTGGPNALLKILSCFPKKLDYSIVVIQHMDSKFTPGMVQWLNKQINLPVDLIEDGDLPRNQHVLFACTDEHLSMRPSYRMYYTKEPIDNCYHPSVDVFFESVAQTWNGEAIGVLLTGMGRDGAKGLLSFKKKGWHTIAQDEKSSVVYGMPKAAMDMGAATEVLSIDKIGPALLKLLKKK
jgi:two-component system response regulator WspF